MSDIETNLQKILTSIYGKDVRQAIHDAIEDCYADSSEGLTPQYYGAKGDGVHDDTEAINAAIQANDTLLIPSGNYRTTGTILINKEMVLECNGSIVYEGTDCAVKITGSIANRTDLYFRDIQARNGTGIKFYSSYFNTSTDTDRVMYVNLYFDYIRAKDKCIEFERGNTGNPNTDGYMNEIHIYNGRLGGDADYGIYADSGSYSAINNVKLINVSLEGSKVGIYLKDNIYRWSFINLRYAEAPTSYHLQTVGLVSDIMWFGTCKVYEQYFNLSNQTSGFIVSPMAQNANYYLARIKDGVLDYYDPKLGSSVQTGSNVDAADLNWNISNERYQQTIEGSFTVGNVTYSKMMFYVGTNGDIALSGHNGSSWTSIFKENITKFAELGNNVTDADISWVSGSERIQQTIYGSFSVGGTTYERLAFFIDADGDMGVSGYANSAWTALSTGSFKVDSTVTAGGTNAVSSTAVIAYINSLDASNTAY